LLDEKSQLSREKEEKKKDEGREARPDRAGGNHNDRDPATRSDRWEKGDPPNETRPKRGLAVGAAEERQLLG